MGYHSTVKIPPNLNATLKTLPPRAIVTWAVRCAERAAPFFYRDSRVTMADLDPRLVLELAAAVGRGEHPDPQSLAEASKLEPPFMHDESSGSAVYQLHRQAGRLAASAVSAAGRVALEVLTEGRAHTDAVQKVFDLSIPSVGNAVAASVLNDHGYGDEAPTLASKSLDALLEEARARGEAAAVDAAHRDAEALANPSAAGLSELAWSPLPEVVARAIELSDRWGGPRRVNEGAEPADLLFRFKVPPLRTEEERRAFVRRVREVILAANDLHLAEGGTGLVVDDVRLYQRSNVGQPIGGDGG